MKKHIFIILFFLFTFYLPVLSLSNGLPFTFSLSVMAQAPTPTIPLLPSMLKTGNGNSVTINNPWIQTPEKLSQELKSGQAALGTFSTSVLTNLMSGTILAVGGEKIQTGVTQNGQPIYSYQGGAAEMVGNLTAMLYTNKPASSVEYLADIGSNLGIVKPAYAQGLGFSAFSPVLELWKLFRNIAYLAFVVIFIVVGFMIMFRKKIDPRTIVTVQDALPRIIITLILITFSYAIAGLIIDFSDLFIKLLANIFFNGTILGTKITQVSRDNVLNSSIFELVNPLRNVQDLVGAIQQSTSVGVNSSGGGIVASLGGLTVGVVLWIAGFYVMFKIFFALLTPFITIVLSVITAPFQLLIGAIPSNNSGFLGWIKTIIANSVVFPVTFALLSIAAYLHSGELLNRCTPDVVTFGKSALWCPPAETIKTLWTPFGMNLGSAVGHLASFGILFTIPKVVEIIQQALQMKPGPMMVGAEELKKSFSGLPFVKNIVG